MNRTLPPGDRGHRSPDPGRASGPPGSLPGALRLVGGTAAAASPIRNGHRCATVGPRSFGARAVPARVEESSRKARHGSAGRARKEGGV